MTTLTSPNYASDWLKGESGAGEYHSRDTGTLGAGQGVLVTGTVLMTRAADGAFLIADGSSPATAVLFDRTNDTSAGPTACIVVARHATVVHQGLTWGPSINTAALRAAACAQLKSHGIVDRQGA